jgi:hypothetical protein
MAQCGADTHDQWRGYMTVLDVIPEILISISTLTTVIRPMIKFDVDELEVRDLGLGPEPSARKIM